VSEKPSRNHLLEAPLTVTSDLLVLVSVKVVFLGQVELGFFQPDIAFLADPIEAKRYTFPKPANLL